MNEQGKGKHQELRLLNRRLLDISGVLNVESFDNEEFLLQTELGHLTITGQQLHIKNLNLEQGLVSIEGQVNSMFYLEPGASSSGKGFFGKLFR